MLPAMGSLSIRKLFVLASLTLVSAAHGSQRSFYTKPDIHGNLVVFTCEGDLWLGDIGTHAARRITSHPGTETNARFSPDGSKIAFTAQYDGGTDVYVMPVGGDAPKRLTYDPKGADVLGWTPDGKSVLFRSRRNSPVGGVRRLYTVPAAGGQPSLVPIPAGEFGSLSNGGELAYVPVSIEWANWFRYKAGQADSIWLADLKGHFNRLTSYRGVDTTPVWCGAAIFFVSERGGVSNLYRLDPKTKAVSAMTHYFDVPVRYPGSDGRRVVFQHGPGLAVYDPETRQLQELSFELGSDRIHSREQRIGLAAMAQSPSIGPSGKRIAVEARGQIVSVAAENGDMRVLENQPGARAMWPAWSPDGKQVAFFSDRSGENELWLTDAAGGKPPRQLTKGLKGNFYAPVWSPDGKALAFGERMGRILLVDSTTGAFKQIDKSDYTGSYDGFVPGVVFSRDSKFIAFNHIEAMWISQVYLVEVASGRSLRVSNPNVNSLNPAFSFDGKFLLYVADSQLTPVAIDATQKYAFDNARRVYMVALSPDTASPFLPKNDEEGQAEKPAPKPGPISSDGLSDRVIEVPMASGRYQQATGVGSKLFLINWTSIPELDGSPAGLGELQAFDLEKKALSTVASNVDSFDVSADGKKLLLRRGNSFAVADPTGAPVAFSPVNLTPYAVTIDPEKEWRQIFEESWRVARDFFYDPKMHGVDWNKVRRKYEALLPMVGDRTDLSRLQADMVSELNAGHAYISNPSPRAPVIPMGYLGADFSPSASAVKITKLFRGDGFAGNRSPLLQPGLKIKEGDYIVSIGGQPVHSDQDIQALLIGTAGQTVALGVNDKPSADGARIVEVQPVPSEDGMRYTDWVQGRAAYVLQHGGDDFGYLHVPDMGPSGVVGFTKGQFPNVNKAGMIYDFRYNGGGYVSSLLLENVGARPQAWFKPRDSETWTRENWANIGYHVALCNEHNFSDGELVIEDWKRMKLGPVIGTRTGGGEVGSGGGYSLIDHGLIYVPNYGAFSDGKWIIEGVGAIPDIEVDQDPEAVMAGRDPQLDKAIEVLKAKIAQEPIKKPTAPPFPNKAGN